MLCRIQELTNEGLNLAGVKRVMKLEAELAEARADLEASREALAKEVESVHRQYRRDLVPLRQTVVPFGQRRRRT